MSYQWDYNALPHLDAGWHTEVSSDEDYKDDEPYWTYTSDNEAHASALALLVNIDTYPAVHAYTWYIQEQPENGYPRYSPAAPSTMMVDPTYAESPVMMEINPVENPLDTFDPTLGGIDESDLVARYLDLSPPRLCLALAPACPGPNAGDATDPSFQPGNADSDHYYPSPTCAVEAITAGLGSATIGALESPPTPEVPTHPQHPQASPADLPAANSEAVALLPGTTQAPGKPQVVYDSRSGLPVGRSDRVLTAPEPVRRKGKRGTVIACVFCRGRKIACGGAPHGATDKTCMQCRRRRLVCQYPPPKCVRRDMHEGAEFAAILYVPPQSNEK
ncbi:hypothetical protein FOMPIDRAFT_84527 [Fomitopsis schrenkii]|uniref:Zn(2)-C6 fungal-type domain-containing protein n=1 Tax=Fomitopsis schrenkii TaxID=2126942 RepID=S8G223_FOMSC|nr:hypothetical protein FOMPIDRAFT_84527 [Fomitopsis schrenkii]